MVTSLQLVVEAVVQVHLIVLVLLLVDLAVVLVDMVPHQHLPEQELQVKDMLVEIVVGVIFLVEEVELALLVKQTQERLVVMEVLER